MIEIIDSNQLNSFINLRLEALKNEPNNFLSTFEEEIKYSNLDWQQKLQNSFWFGFFQENNLIAMISFEIAKKNKINHTAEIGGLYIKHSHRNLGIATKLIKFVEYFAKQKNILQIYLGCNFNNKIAINL
ncbi:MAG: GNAT family N-acetyltransferase, partial [Rickettsiales bacterium]